MKNNMKDDLPIGLSMSLAQDMNAMGNFISAPEKQRERMVEYIRASTSGDEAKSRVDEVVRKLGDDKYL